MRRLTALWLVVTGCGTETVPGERPDPDILTPNGATGIVTGRVVDSNGTAVPTAFVLIESDPVEVTTDAGGEFSAEVPAGDHNLSVTKHGETFVNIGITVEPEETHDLGDVGPSNPFIYARMSVREASYLRTRFHQANTWAAITIEDEVGLPVRGLTMADVTVTDRIREISTGNVVAENIIDIPTQNANQFMEAGVWEHSRTREKLDVVFLMDHTSSMSDESSAVATNVHDFVDRLQAANVDFRVAGVTFGSNPNFGWHDIIPFYGDWELDRLHEELDAEFGTGGGESWSPTAAYEGLMITEWLDYRDDARKVAVIVTDVVPHTVYGTYWYPVTSSVMTASAMEMFIADNGIELYFAQDPSVHSNIETYVDNDINPRAGNHESGLYGLEARGFATELGWPFDEVELSNTLGLVADQPVIDAQYLVGWEPVAGWTSPWADAPEDYEQYVTIAIDDPVRPGEILSASFTLPMETPLTDVDVNVLMENDNDPGGVRADLFRLCGGGRPVEYGYQLQPLGGVIALQLPPGRYRVEGYQGGDFDDNSLVAIGRADFEVGVEPTSVDVTVKLAEARGVLARTRGLLRDLDDWRISGDPFRDFVMETEAWLIQVEQNGISWEEMVQLRRFNNAMAGYANLTEYAQLESASAVEDFVDIVADFRQVVAQVKKVQSTTQEKWYTEVAGALIEFAMAYLTQGEFSKEKQALEAALKALFDYAGGPLQKELKKYVIDQYPPNLEILGSLTELTLTLLDAHFNSDGQDADWGPVIEAVQKVALDAALIAARETIVEDQIDNIMDEIEVETQWEDDIRGLIRNILNSLVRRNHNIKDFQRAMEKFARDVGNTLLVEDRENTIATINRMFDHVQGKLNDYPDVRDFLVSFARDLTLAALPELKCYPEDSDRCRVVYKLNTDAIVEILIRHGLYNVVLRHYYVEEANRGLGLALERAQNFTLPPGAPYDWENAMHADFADYRPQVGAAQAVAWNALRQQEAVDEWANGLEMLTQLLFAISKPLDFIAAVYPPLEDTAEAVHGFIIALDAIHITTQAVEFGLKVDCLCRFGNLSRDLYANAYPH